MNVFETHAKIIGDYASYIHSFINIADEAISQKVNTALNEGKLWPEPLLQFNPAYEMVGSVSEVAQDVSLNRALTDIFKGYSLYRHQVEAIKLGRADKDFVVTSGTGSGKSLTYIGSIFHRLLEDPQSKGVTAIVVYPMNALINSQTNEFKTYKENYEKSTGKEFPITFGQYTGQEKQEVRSRLRDNPPHVLLTNYMMLELLLTRVQERPIRDAIYDNLRFLVFDELHTYRGRQGADVAMLIRRIGAQCKQPVTCIGTSATMVSVGSIASQRERVAGVATTMFGRPFRPDQVIHETLARSLTYSGLPARQILAQALSGGINTQADEATLRSHPVAVWLENRIALEEREGQLARRRPLRIGEVVSALADDSGVPEDACKKCLADLLLWISTVNQRLRIGGSRYTILPFKLHQFIAQTGSVYTTLDQDENRFITLEPGIYKQDDENKKAIFPNVFSRATGHPFICVSRIGDRLEFQWALGIREKVDAVKALPLLNRFVVRLDDPGFLEACAGDPVWREAFSLLLQPLLEADPPAVTNEHLIQLVSYLDRIRAKGLRLPALQSARIYFLGRRHADAIELWDEAGAKPNEYLTAKASVEPYPQRILSLSKLKLAGEIVEAYSAARETALNPEQASAVIDALGHSMHLVEAFNLAWEQSLAIQMLRLSVIALRKVGDKALASSALQGGFFLYAIQDHWERVAAFASSLDFVPEPDWKSRDLVEFVRSEADALQITLVRALAHSEKLPDAPTHLQRQLSDFLRRYLRTKESGWRAHITVFEAGSAFERAGRFIDAIVFYESVTKDGFSDVEKNFARQRWLMSKQRQLDYEKAQGATLKVSEIERDLRQAQTTLGLKTVDELPRFPELPPFENHRSLWRHQE